VSNEINLTNVPLSAVLHLYSQLCGRTLLRHPELPTARLAITGSSANTAATAHIFAHALTNCGIAVIADGDKFLQLVPQSLAATVQPRSVSLNESRTAAPPPVEELPAGSIDFTEAFVEQAAPIYAELIGRKFDRVSSQALPQPLPTIVLKTQTALTKAEIAYALEVHFAWRGVKLVPVDDKLARLVPLNEK